MDRITFNMSKVLSAHTNLPEAGAVMYKSLVDAILSHNVLVVDMMEVTSLPSIFLNVSVGKAIDEYGKEELKKHLTFTNITRLQASRIKEYMSRYN